MRTWTDPAVLIERRRQRYYRDDIVRWVWIVYGLTQAVVTMLMAFGVVEGTTLAAVVTAVALVVYVGLNELFVRPYRWPKRPKAEQIDELPLDDEDEPAL